MNGKLKSHRTVRHKLTCIFLLFQTFIVYVVAKYGSGTRLISDMADLFNDIGTSSPDKKEDSPKPNKRKTRKNKGGRPCLQDTKSMLFDGY